MPNQGFWTAPLDATADRLNAALVQYGTTAARPAAGQTGRMWWSTDDKKFSRDNGTTWDDMVPHAHVASSQDVATSESTTSLSYTDLATTGPAVTLSPGVTTTQFIVHSCQFIVTGGAGAGLQSVAIAGATALDVDGVTDTNTAIDSAYAPGRTRPILAVGVANGSTHTCKYRVAAFTCNFFNRRIVAYNVA